MDVTIDVTRKIIETERLILRGWKETDLNDFYEYASVEGVGEMAGWQHHTSMDVSKSILQNFISDKDVFAITYKENNKVIGSLGLHESWANEDTKYKDMKQKEIGYVLSKEYWGKGLIPEATLAVIKFCFEECGLDALTIGHFTSNNQSKRVIEKCGFHFVKNSKIYSNQTKLTYEEMRYILFRT